MFEEEIGKYKKLKQNFKKLLTNFKTKSIIQLSAEKIKLTL